MRSLGQWVVIAGLMCAVGCGPQPSATSGNQKPNPTTAAPGTKPPGSPTPTPPVEEKYKVVFQEGKLSINGTTFSSPPELTEVEKVLGKPSSIDEKGINNRVYWKEPGVMVLQDKSSKRLTTIHFHFDGYYSVGDQSFGDPFKGSVTINGEKIVKDAKAVKLEEKLKLKKTNDLERTLVLSDGTWIFIKGSDVYEVIFDFSLMK